VRSKSGVPMTADLRGISIYFGSGHRQTYARILPLILGNGDLGGGGYQDTPQ
jgi:hypothetical protein